MTREAFLNDLKNALAGMKEEEIESVLAYYSEMIDDRVEAGMTEEEALNAMEPAETIASRVLSEAEIETDLAEKASEQTDEKQSERQKEIRRSADSVSELVVLADNQRICLTVGESDDVVLRYHIDDNDVYQLHEENGVLTLEHTCRPICSYKLDASRITGDNFFDEMGKFFKGLRLGNLINFNVESAGRCIQVELPRVFKGKIHAKSCNARIVAENLISHDDIELHTSNARVEMSHISARSLTAVSSNARIVLKDVYVNGALEAATSNGRIIAENVTADQGVQLKTSNGRIEVSMLGAQSIILKTSNSSITGSVRGTETDYAISTSTSNARSNLADRAGGEKQLIARTSNGSISIEFAD